MENENYEQTEVDELEELFDYMIKKEKEEKYQKFFSKFSNLPKSTQLTMIINIAIIIATIALSSYCFFVMNYFRWELLLVVILLTVFLTARTITLKHVFSNLDFIIFTGEISEVFHSGNKVINNEHLILKLVSDEGKELCVRYFENAKKLLFGQKISVFLRPDAEITASEYGLIAEEYIVIVPTDDITAKLELEEMKDDSSSLSVEDYLKK